MELEVPEALVGKTLTEAQLRKQHEIEVVLIRRLYDPESTKKKRTTIMPSGRYVLQKGDMMVVCGEESKLDALEKL
jgi:Trk K+ transport system NAD-binding subunit